MAERLTEHKTRKGITRVVVRPSVCEFQTVLNKLCAFEDIMEKYDIEDLEQLDIMLFCLSSETKFQLKQLQKLYKKYKIKNVEELEKELSISRLLHQTIAELSKMVTKVEKDRDTWKKACELACEREDDCYVYDNIHRAYEFYQQAKQFAGR